MTTATLGKLLRREDLKNSEAHDLMSAIMAGELSGAEIGAVLVALRMKGETVTEIAGFAAAMREKAVPISPGREGLVDTCGTGGDSRQTFNISTATALVAAAMGVPVAKHGNRAVSSSCGSADVLEALGVRIELEPEEVAGLIDEVGIGFLFAPRHHPAMKHAAPVRKQLGIRTVFNLLGPLTNPAGVKRQLLGVFAPDLTEPVCRVLGDLGAERAFVVHGRDGTDEVSIAGETVVSEWSDGRVRTYEFTPEDAGLRRAGLDEIGGGSSAENAAHILHVLNGNGGPRSDAVLLNTGFVAVLGGRAGDVAHGVDLAREAIESGDAQRLLEDLRRASSRRAGEAS
jgi:anthranilate phosphoribosyltransferase